MDAKVAVNYGETLNWFKPLPFLTKEEAPG
jgi:hypothetical protein